MEPTTPADSTQDDARQRLIQSALTLFVERGYAATSVREIVAAAGVTKPVLYYYFGNKEGIFLYIMNYIGVLFDQRVGEIGTVAGTARRRIIHLLTSIFDGATENLPLVRFAYSIFFGPPQGTPFVDLNRFFDIQLEVVGGLIDEGIRSGEIRECDRQALAWAIMSGFNTVLEEQLCRPEPRIGRDGLVSLINMVLDGVSAPSPGGGGS